MIWFQMREEEMQVLPSVVWRHVASLLDLAGQAALAATCRWKNKLEKLCLFCCRELMDIVVSHWRRRLSQFYDQIKIIGDNYR